MRYRSEAEYMADHLYWWAMAALAVEDAEDAAGMALTGRDVDLLLAERR